MNDGSSQQNPLRVLVVDDETLARARMRTLLGDCPSPAVTVQGEAANAVQAMELLQHQQFDVALLDIQLPGADGLVLAARLREMTNPPVLIFVTAHAEHAVKAFELEAVDYLTKPVRLERLQAALQKAVRYLKAKTTLKVMTEAQETLLIPGRNRMERVALHEVIYFKAELKYLTVRTVSNFHILEGSLNEMESRYSAQFVRIHRNALIARACVRALEKSFDPEEGEGWAVRLHGVDELLMVSRRQLPSIRALLAQ